MDKWISVDERVPEWSCFVIAYKHNGIVVGLLFNNEKKFMYGRQDQTSQVTHWQPLPAPPKVHTQEEINAWDSVE